MSQNPPILRQMNIKIPPERIHLPALEALKDPENLSNYLKFHTPFDKEERYLPYDELRHRIMRGLDHQTVWSLVKEAREKQWAKIINLGEPSQPCHYLLTPQIQKAISAVDRYTTNAALELMSNNIGERTQIKYLLRDLIQDESISSSQLEGAATTTIIAKNMLRQHKKPRTLDEKMIMGNYRLMRFVWQNRQKPLTLNLLSEMHSVGVEGIDDDAYAPGHFRKTNDIYVVDRDNQIVHTPPDCENLKERLQDIAHWANTNHEEDDDSSYLHPLIKAITLHFCIGYEHPFKDGNGRVARALFYWYLFKNNFGAFRYVAISTLLKDAAVKYGKSYLYTETDEMDMTYFISYQSGVILRAIEKFQSAYEKNYTEIRKFDEWLLQSGLFGQLNDKQRIIFAAARNGQIEEFTTRGVENILNCSYNTAASVLNGLVTLELFYKNKQKNQWIYKMKSQPDIVDDWDKF